MPTCKACRAKTRINSISFPNYLSPLSLFLFIASAGKVRGFLTLSCGWPPPSLDHRWRCAHRSDGESDCWRFPGVLDENLHRLWTKGRGGGGGDNRARSGVVTSTSIGRVCPEYRKSHCEHACSNRSHCLGIPVHKVFFLEKDRLFKK